ncbi:MAG: lactate utilization protein [Deltaproteobacteria bacterium]|jgi:L-lactate utilization protein LutB|nr:lactate utilization protein [Deltaproteobacteria bacterium]
MNFDLETVKKNFIRRGFQAVVCDDLQQATRFIIEKFPVNNDMIIGMGNSLTLDAIGIKKIWAAQASVYQHTLGSSESETKKALLADIYLTSANAVSSDGQIINIDGTGNRTAATCYGPKQVIYVIGKNKIAVSLEEAIKRARNTAAVQNAKRYSRKTPCAVTGKCENCLSPECICAVMTIHRKQPYGVKIMVVLVNEAAGF